MLESVKTTPNPENQELDLTKAVDKYLAGEFTSADLEEVADRNVSDYGNGSLALSTSKRQVKQWLNLVNNFFRKIIGSWTGLRRS
jgi:hypothetical protein